MNDLSKLINTSEPTMSSREIAELCDKEHRHVRRDIENLNATYEQMGMPKMGQTPYTHEQNGQTYYEYQLTKEQTIDLITGYRADLRIRINRRWQELEQTNTPTDPLLMIAHMAQQAYETKILAQQVAHRQDSIEHTIKEIQAKQEALTDSSNFFSVLAFANLHEIGLTNGKLSALSRKAGKYSEKLGMAVGTISDPRWGRVKTYHKDVLTELFELESLI